MALSGDLATIFNNGCDARLIGLPQQENPYDPSDEIEVAAYTNWKHGWKHVDQCWGIDVKGRWLGKPLPPVEEVNGRRD